MEEYEANRKARLEHDHQWWGDTHVEPAEGNPDRQHIYAHNPTISDQEFGEVVQAFRKSITNTETGELDSLSVQLRPTTPPLERATKQLQGLKDQDVEMSDELEKEIIHQFTTNNGMVAALTEWCRDKLDVPVEHANQLMKMIHRLNLEMSKQQRDLQYELDQTKTSLKESVEEAYNSKQNIATLEADLAMAKAKNEVSGTLLEKSAEEFQDAEEEFKEMTAFHDEVHKKLRAHAATWMATKNVYDKLSQDDQNARPEIKTLINKTSLNWAELDSMYDRKWLPVAKALEQTDNRNGIGLLGLIEQKGEELRDKENEVDQLRGSIAEQTKKLEQKDQEIERLKLKLHEMFSSKLSGIDTPEHSQYSSNTSMASSFNSIQMEEEIKRLKQQNSGLQKMLANNSKGKDKDKDKASSSADTSPQDGNELKVALEEIQNLRAQVQTQTGDIEKLNGIVNRKERVFEKQFGSPRQESNLYRNRLKEVETAQFKTADKLILAIGKNDSASSIDRKMGLRDRINYLNLVCFFRTRNYIQLAIREGANRMANALLEDIEGWAKFCHKDFETMDPSVNILIEASIRILHDVRTIVANDTEEDLKAAQESIQAARDVFEQYPIEGAFFQLDRLADQILQIAQEQAAESHTKKMRFIFADKLHVGRTRRVDIRSKVRNASGMKSAGLRLPGVHSPVSSEK
ncbi:hypothetical protein NXS19_003694 [Fusarium pseudograminearum]|uniref:Uncharacterized protein n=1 Tax=Fusarium pseudograminearum (strain CS3096) TaxID=1028729 RepID=K3W151_FUSPC|nr:hypothetical protein FPSE_04547 [Fusarium pseudograminearum CS3096]EKJ75290.1 hypothetical protein FPSE_04547 [Fusarium pseudograminearum CS3096]KAF0641634.1 hypothetical protein FPSE5266_04547 [Fusarium pseudograminearum]UZP35878.1 hypothetical protein NXS19_003694 [Fusarium pseudograminearum]